MTWLPLLPRLSLQDDLQYINSVRFGSVRRWDLYVARVLLFTLIKIFSLIVLEIFALVALGVFMALLRMAYLVVFRKFSGLYASLTIYELQTTNSELSYVLNDCGLRLQRSQPFSRSCSAFWERRVVSWT